MCSIEHIQHSSVYLIYLIRQLTLISLKVEEITARKETESAG